MKEKATPAPDEYVLPIDPGKVPSLNERPLTSRRTFLNQDAKTYNGLQGT